MALSGNQSLGNLNKFRETIRTKLYSKISNCKLRATALACMNYVKISMKFGTSRKYRKNNKWNDVLPNFPFHFGLR